MSTSENHSPHSTKAVALPEDAKWYQDRVLIAIILVAALLGLVYNGIILLGYGPDEPRHMNYVRLLFNEHRLPYLEPDPAAPGRLREHAAAHSLHPPLYYVLLLPFYAISRVLPAESEWHLLRVLSLLLCVGALPLWYETALRAGNGTRWFARLATAHIALLPIFGMTSGVINNDSASFFAAALFVWLLAVKYPHERSLKSAAVLGVCFGLGGLCKATVLLCDGIALMVYLWLQRELVPVRSLLFWKRVAIVAAGVMLFSGPWYARNVALYGQFAGPIERGYSLVDMNWLPPGGPLVMMMHPNFPQLFGMVNWSVSYSMWSQKDWIPAIVRNPIYYVFTAYCLIALASMAWRSARRKTTPDDVTHAHIAGRIAFWASLGAFLINWLACVVIALFQHWGWHEGGRYLLPSLGGLMILLATGWNAILGERRLRIIFHAWCLALLILNGVTIYWLLHYLNPKYGPGA